MSGPQFLGLSDPLVGKEIAKLPGYVLCRQMQGADTQVTETRAPAPPGRVTRAGRRKLATTSSLQRPQR